MVGGETIVSEGELGSWKGRGGRKKGQRSGERGFAREFAGKRKGQ